MEFKIINNLDVEKHGTRIKSLIQSSDSVIIASPFLLPDFAKFLSELSWDNTKKLHLITTLVPASEDQIKKIKSLYSLVAYTTIHKIDCKISINNKLHAKIYIFKKKEIYSTAIISSANMTDNGLYHSHEWGVEITEKNIIEKIYHDLKKSLDYESLSASEIKTMFEKAAAYSKQNKIPKKRTIPLNLLNSIPKTKLEVSVHTKYWLKPIGSMHNYVDPNELFDQETAVLHFSKKTPKEVSIGDILIAFAVGSGKIISIYKMQTEPDYNPKIERWPWYVEGLNLSPDYGAKWWKNNITKEALKIDFEKQYPDEKIKPYGKQSYGAFQFGWDRMQITPSFANFIIDKILY